MVSDSFVIAAHTYRTYLWHDIDDIFLDLTEISQAFGYNNNNENNT